MKTKNALTYITVNSAKKAKRIVASLLADGRIGFYETFYIIGACRFYMVWYTKLEGKK